MPKVLLVDTNISSAPIYNYLVRAGFEVFLVGGNPNDYLAKTVKNYINMDYSNIKHTQEIMDRFDIDYIVPGCNDRSYQVCANINSKGKYPGLDSMEKTEIINKKDKFRKIASKIGLPVPKVIANNSVGKIWPVIVKPVDAYSGRGMTIVKKNQQQMLQAAINRAIEYSQSKKYIVEEYIKGQLYSHSAFISNEKIVADFIVEEHGTANPFVVDTSRLIYDFPMKILSRIRDSITLLAEELKLSDGLIHTQFIKNMEAFWLIEVTRRCPGDLYSKLVELSTDFRYAETYVRPFINKPYSFQNNKTKRSWVMRHTISQPREGIVGSIEFKYPIIIEKYAPLSLAGDMIKASPFGRIALIFVRSKTEEELLELYNRTLKRKLYTIREI